MHELDEISNDSSNPTFHQVVEARLSRRSMIGGGFAAAAAGFLGIDSLLRAVPAAAAGSPSVAPSVAPAQATSALLGFQGIPTSTADAVVVPPGYTARVLIAWGDPISVGPAFAPDASNSADDQALQWGMHNDGLVYFPINGSARGLIVQNHEYTDDVLLVPDGTAGWSEAKTAKSLNAHGVSVIEVTKQGRGKERGTPGGQWRVVRPSPYARRITGQTPIDLAGPAAGDPRLATDADPSGTRVLGTLNNCAMGFTPWNTYLACEENFNGYFTKSAAARTAMDNRYGIGGGFGYLWSSTPGSRFNADLHPNEPHRFGWVTEIDPFDPTSTPTKRTALGRIKHEGAWVQEADDGRVVVYSGDDEQFEYIYRYVSARPWRQMRRDGVSPLDEGTLYVARFDADGSGQWLALTPEQPALQAALRPGSASETGWTIEDILIFTRRAADLVGATKMDRPEWIDTFPESLTAIATLTNNSRRGTTAPVDAANPRANNVYGHIVRWSYANDWTEDSFAWDIFALAGDPAAPASGSTIVGDKYGSPDGIYVAPSGRLWIQTDVSGSTIDAGAYAGFGNNQMLCADPTTRETRRFLVGPKVCEVTGVFVTPDERTMFVGIQHPGEAPTGVNDPANPKRYSSWPDGPAGGRPRSSLVVVTKDDGGVIGS